MQNLFIGKFIKKDQYEGNFYQVSNEREISWLMASLKVTSSCQATVDILESF